jgi:hypothetical protein
MTLYPPDPAPPPSLAPVSAGTFGRALLRLGALGALALAVVLGGCRARYVLVSIQVPPGLTYAGIALDKFVGDVRVGSIDVAFEREETSGTGSGRTHQVDVEIPADADWLRLRAQLFRRVGQVNPASPAAEVIAQGEVTIAADADTATLQIVLCLPAHPKTIDRTSCTTSVAGVPVPDGGTGADADAGIDGPSVDVPADLPLDVAAEGLPDRPGDDGGPAGPWRPVGACVKADPTATPPLIVPDQVSKECETYCLEMDKNCNAVFLRLYENQGRCRYACKELQWQTQTGAAQDNTIECRTIWASMHDNDILTQSQNCERASPNSAGACGSVCEVYCHMGRLICGADHFPPETACINACGKLREQLRLAEPVFYGEHMKCRLEILQKAVLNRDLCSWAAPNTSCGECASRPLNLEL